MRRFTWDDLQFFLAVARNGQLASAARQLRTNHATVSRRIDRLEQALSAKLFERNPRGYMLTAVGERLVQSAEQIEREAANFRNEAASGASQVTGVLRLSTLEGFGSYFLADRLPRFAEAHANLSIELVTIQQIVSLSRREADMSITLTSPRTDFYHYEKITTYRLFVYGTRSYLDSHPPIEKREDLLAHRMIGYIEDMIFTPGLDYHREILPGLRASYQSSSIHAQLRATLKGVGLCVLPHFMAAGFDELVPVLTRDILLERDYWCVSHRDLSAAPRIRALAEFVQAEARSAAQLFLGDHLVGA
ncbi:MAG: LysR family transcriptional regulator [Mesorhizobium sp.]|jgi:DNA-binding transcriptional LysR family regulator|uniref:LysR family transcriptional regulator n=1 Tax=Ollibium composti TaxID=2675109 RepID=A0ABY2Q810_9HYPH|nr:MULTISPECIES: LysR family transcriptional regulator [Mesorhizobium]QDC00430.1 LysR family transcriptional regulator [Mesorhizobium sp. 8]THF57765.1 LysR family transcriptional regulator [Mesorhizobium composti]